MKQEKIITTGDDRAGAPKRFARYEVIREKRDGAAPDIEEHLGLDFARVAALGYALKGRPWPYTSRVTIKQVWFTDGCKRLSEHLIDDIDERVAMIVLNGIKLPRAWTEAEGLASLA